MNIIQEELENLVEMFKLLSSEARLKIIVNLYDGEKNVGEICAKVSMSQPAVSHHLKELRQGRIVKSEKIGKEVNYSLKDSHIVDILSIALRHLRHENCDE